MSNPEGSSKKRTIADLWMCSCCLGTLEDNCVPAVMNCQPFAHAICVTCADVLLENPPAKCPKCSAEFTSVRPLVEFVNTDDGDVAATLAKKAKPEGTFEQKLNAILATINNNIVAERVKFLAERITVSLQFMDARASKCVTSGNDYVPEFDKKYVRIRVSGKGWSREKLQFQMKTITGCVLEHVRPLFPGVYIEPYSNPDRPCQYLWIRVTRK